MSILLTHLQSKQVLSSGDKICSYNQLWSLNEWNRLPIDYVNASNVNMFKKKLQISQKGGLHVDDTLLDSR